MGDNAEQGGGQPPATTNMIDAGSELVQPVVDHAAKIAHIEEQQAQQQERLYRDLGDLEERLRTATGEHAQRLEERIAQLESRLEALATPPVEAASQTAEEAVEFAAPEVESSPAPPEKMRKGMRHRKRARRKGKGAAN